MKKLLKETEIKRFATLANVKLSDKSLNRLITEAKDEQKDEDEDEATPEDDAEGGMPPAAGNEDPLPPPPDGGEGLPPDAGAEAGVPEDKIEALVSAIADAIATETGISVEVEGGTEGAEDVGDEEDLDGLDLEGPPEGDEGGELPPDGDEELDIEDDEELPPVKEAHENPRLTQKDEYSVAEGDRTLEEEKETFSNDPTKKGKGPTGLKESQIKKVTNRVIARLKKIQEAKKVATAKKTSPRLRKLQEARKRQLMIEAKVEKVYARVVRRLIAENKRHKLVEARKQYLAKKTAAKAKK